MAEDVKMSLTPADDSLGNHGNDIKVFLNPPDDSLGNSGNDIKVFLNPPDDSLGNDDNDRQASLTPADDSLGNHGNDSKVSVTPADDNLCNHGIDSKVSVTPADDNLGNHGNDSKVSVTPADDNLGNHGNDSKVSVTPADDNLGNHDKIAAMTVEQMIESDDCEGDSDDDLAEVPDNDFLKYDVIDVNTDVDGVSSVEAKDKLKEVSYRKLILKDHNIKDSDIKMVSMISDNLEAKITMGTASSQLEVIDGVNTSEMTDVYKCCACNEILRTEGEIAEHTRAHANSNLCSVCGRAFDSSKAVLLHKSYCSRGMEKLAKEETGIFKCKLCDRMYNYKSTLKNHLRTFHAEKSHVCCVCDKGFATERDLQRHSYTHTDSASKPFKCDKPGCNKAFTCRSSYNKHVRIKHEKNKVYRCTVCTRAFEMECDIKRHILTHTNIRPFKCTLCTKSYTCKSSLRQHISLIHEKKKLTCLFCNKLFYTNQDLERHVTTHTGSKAWQCSRCKKRYSCKSALTVHKRNAHGIFFVNESENTADNSRSWITKDMNDKDMKTKPDDEHLIAAGESLLQSGDPASGLLDSDLLGVKSGSMESDGVTVLPNNEGDVITKEKRRKSKKPRKTKVMKIRTEHHDEDDEAQDELFKYQEADDKFYVCKN